MRIQKLRSGLLALTLLLGLAAGGAHAKPPLPALDPGVARGKQLLFIYHATRIEEEKSALPYDPVRIARYQAQYDNDLALMKWFESLGFVVTGVHQFTPLSVAEGSDLIVISETIDAAAVNTKPLRELAVPIVTLEKDVLGELGMTGGNNFGREERQPFIEIVNAPHPLAAGLPAGLVNVVNDGLRAMNWGRPGAGAITIATIRGERDKASIFAYEKGATMHWVFIAPARRVSFFETNDSFLPLRPEGLELLRSAVLWAVSPPG